MTGKEKRRNWWGEGVLDKRKNKPINCKKSTFGNPNPKFLKLKGRWERNFFTWFPVVTGVTRRALNVLLRSERARGREGVVTERESCDGERRSYAEGVETETGKREKELKVFESMRCICSKWNSSLEETSYSWNLFLSQLQTWQSWQKFKCNSSLGETSFNWNSSLLETSRLYPSIDLKQYDFAK